jgi:hypothetical protein
MKASLLWGNFIDTPTAVVYKKDLDAIDGFDEDLPRYEDWDLFLRLSNRGIMLFIEDPLILSYHTNGSVSCNDMARKQALLEIYSKNKKAILQNKKLNAWWLRQIGNTQIRNKSKREGYINLFRATKYNPLYILELIKSMKYLLKE